MSHRRDTGGGFYVEDTIPSGPMETEVCDNDDPFPESTTAYPKGFIKELLATAGTDDSPTAQLPQRELAAMLASTRPRRMPQGTKSGLEGEPPPIPLASQALPLEPPEDTVRPRPRGRVLDVHSVLRPLPKWDGLGTPRHAVPISSQPIPVTSDGIPIVQPERAPTISEKIVVPQPSMSPGAALISVLASWSMTIGMISLMLLVAPKMTGAALLGAVAVSFVVALFATRLCKANTRSPLACFVGVGLAVVVQPSAPTYADSLAFGCVVAALAMGAIAMLFYNRVPRLEVEIDNYPD